MLKDSEIITTQGPRCKILSGGLFLVPLFLLNYFLFSPLRGPCNSSVQIAASTAVHLGTHSVRDMIA